MPSGAKRITTLTISETPLDSSESRLRVVSLAWRKAMPRPMAQARMPMKLAEIRALTGLSTTLSSRDWSTSAMPPGGDISPGWLASTRLEGKAKLAITATTAALKVPTRYSSRIGRIWVCWPCLWLAMDAITRTNTSTGATAFSAETKTLPMKPTLSAAAGKKLASSRPAIRPTMIWPTRLVRVSR